MRVIAFIVAFLAATSGTPRTRVSFIVSARRAQRSVSSAELRRMFLGQTSRWSDGRRIIIYVRPSNTAEGRVFLDRLIRMSDIDYSQWWIGAVFRGEAAATPRVIDSPDAMIKAVAENADAIGFIATPNNVSGDVTVLAVDGKQPSDAAYPIAQ